MEVVTISRIGSDCGRVVVASKYLRGCVIELLKVGTPAGIINISPSAVCSKVVNLASYDE